MYGHAVNSVVTSVLCDLLSFICYAPNVNLSLTISLRVYEMLGVNPESKTGDRFRPMSRFCHVPNGPNDIWSVKIFDQIEKYVLYV